MPDMLAIVSRPMFEKWSDGAGLGDVLPWRDYESAAPALSLLNGKSRLFLVTVRPPLEHLWLVAIYDRLKHGKNGWLARDPNTTPITDITHLRSRLKFDNGKGLSLTPGRLGNSLQTPRVLTAADRALLEAALKPAGGSEDEGWFEVADLDPERFRHLYAADALLTVGLGVGSTEHDYDMRYEHARMRIADLLNRARSDGLAELGRHTFDVWLGQRSVFGHFVDEMVITFAGRAALPVDLLRRSAAREKLAVAENRHHPLLDGVFPELRVADGTLSGKWPLSADLMLALSRAYQAAHGLLPATRDPYLQMAMGAPEPGHFTWLPRVDLLQRRAVEIVPSEKLVAAAIPDEIDRATLASFAFTFDAVQVAGSVERAIAVAQRVESSVAEMGDLSTISTDELRTWLYFEGRDAQKGDEIRHDEVGEVLAELRRRVRRPMRVPSPELQAGVCSPASPVEWTEAVQAFALSFDAYSYWGSSRRTSAEADRVRTAHAQGRLPRSLIALRTALFFEQRRWRHFGDDPTGEDLDYIRDVVAAIRDAERSGD